MITRLLIVGAGGALGAMARYGLSTWVARSFERFPAGTLVVNVLGCFLIGVFMALVEEDRFFSQNVRLFATIGLFGGLTTFSTFGHETIELMRDQETKLALLSVALNVALGLGAVLLGRAVAKLF